MNSQIIQEIFNIKSSSVDDMKNLLKQVKSHKDEKLLLKIGILEKELKEIQKAKKYGLVWEEKEEIFDKETIGKLPILEEIKDGNINQDITENNILINGDNYHTLSVLNYTHAGKIDVIYIDPPYNTGNNDFIYNDKIVDKEDKFRHSKWLSFMNKRLRLAKNLLSESGVIFISIDENELYQLKLLCDEIFGEENFLANIIWDKRNPKGNTKGISVQTENILVYSRNKEEIKEIKVKKENAESIINKAISIFKKDISLDEKNNEFRKWLKLQNSILEGEKAYNSIDEKGKVYRGISMDSPSISKNTFNILHPITNKACKIPSNGWRYKKETLLSLIEENLILFGKDESTIPNKKIYLEDYMDITLSDIIYYAGTGVNELMDLGFTKKHFETVKPLYLIKRILEFSNKNSIILDFFAGSGTTGHAVLELNKEDGGNRKFILVTNNENNICEEVTYERIKRVMTGYKNQKGDQVEGLGGNMTYLKNTFIDKHNSNDDLRLRMVARCSELLCLKENIWEEVKQKNDKIKLFKRNDKYLAILYDMFYFDEFKEVLNNLDKDVSIYAFSYYKLNKTDFEGLKIKFEIEQIPDPILEVYESIFGL